VFTARSGLALRHWEYQVWPVELKRPLKFRR